MKASEIQKESLFKTIFPTAVLACFIIAYLPAFQKLFIRWDSGDNNYCYLIIPLFLYLCWERRNTFRFSDFTWSPWGLIPVIFSVLLILVGELGSVETLLYTGMWGCVLGLIVTLYGWRTRYLIFPLIILLFIVPLPPFVNRMLTFNLKMAASTLSVTMLRAVGVSVLQEGNVIDLGIDQLQVVDACSGLRYLMPLILMSLLVGYFFNKGWWKRMILLLMVLPLSVFVNAFRIWVTGLLTVKGHTELAQSFFHDFSGWLVFMMAAGVLVGAAVILKKVGQKRAENEKDHYHQKDETDDNRKSGRPGLLKPAVLSAILCVMFLGSGWALKSIPANLTSPERATFESFPMEIAEWKGKKQYISKEILDELWADDYVNATFYKEGSPNLFYLFIPFYKYQGTRHTAHAPQSCLLGGGWDLLKSQERVIKLNPGGDIKIMTMILKKGNTKLLGSYFFFQRGRVITSPWLNKFYLMWDAFTKRRTDGALVRVEMTVAPNQSMEEAYVILEDFIENLWNKLPEYVPD